MKIVSIIPARGGSKSIPKKNIQLINQKPLLAYSIAYSLKSKLVNKTVVTTDSTEIAVIAKKYGAMVPFLRPAEYADDDSRDYLFMRHALDYFENEGEIYDLYVLLRPTSPIRSENLIERSIDILNKYKNATSVRSVAKIKEHPLRAWKANSEGGISGFVDDLIEPYNWPRQELPEIYFQTGDIEVIKRETLLSGSISGSNVYPLLIEHSEMLDIDNFKDLGKASDILKS
ncbi:acylneuraminate cytidylyltransferase family protein [bacterium]|nr:acylneuraminate cytidylyltransferase family protein [bacterium]